MFEKWGLNVFSLSMVPIKPSHISGFGYFRLFIVATGYLSGAPRRQSVVTGDSARIQD